MEVRKDGGEGPWPPSGASSAPAQRTCYRSALITFFIFFLTVGVFGGFLIGESESVVKYKKNSLKPDI